MYFDRQGNAISWDQWCAYKGDPGVFEGDVRIDYSRVGWDEPKPGVIVSTVWLGINHGWDNERPLIFETMVFGGPWDQDCRRYESEVEAICGHMTVVDRIANGQEPW